ncbi:hypothetical protein [Jiulongibacter sediminis]|jgi:hypothetical protein|uniref:Uncharacterized protein n=1 Tax=Jiulongibacter sediminis TaxID=1605367 RepID=A0A0P7BGB0_9BACT|nr:hypothetical protein [Jiulongibacter sediminis]KPM49993.1 hypothetical protein AFM12_05420 [Jiulongibacter sediminis]TBX27023.1 hypothetical protein TK44_05425 [Jiulongibacter sediminis]
MKKYLNTLILFGSLAFLIMWVDRIVYKGEELKYNYFFLMFALAGFLFYTYRRGLQKIKEKEEEEKKNSKGKKPKRKTK